VSGIQSMMFAFDAACRSAIVADQPTLSAMGARRRDGVQVLPFLARVRGPARGPAAGGCGDREECFREARLFTHCSRTFLPIASGGRRFIIAATTTELSNNWNADTHWITSSTDDGVLAKMQCAAGEGMGDLSPLAPRNLDPLPTHAPARTPPATCARV
jgi:hypothetical protein